MARRSPGTRAPGGPTDSDQRTLPSLPTSTVARSPMPGPSSQRPYAFATSPFGWKSASSGKSIPSKLSAHALWQNLESMEIPRTWVSQASNFERSPLRPGISMLQVGVKSSG